MPEHLTLPVSQLREGDIVLHFGMRILIDGPAKIHSRTGEQDVYVWPGLVLNADEICDKGGKDYNPYLAKHLRGIWWEDRVPRPRKDDWSIQSNDLMYWTVERTVTEKEETTDGVR